MRKEYTNPERLKLLAAALDLCPNCAAEYWKYVAIPGRDPFEMFREVLWKWFGQWSHGAGCPSEAFPEARQGAPADTRAAPAGQAALDTSTALPTPSGAQGEAPQPYSFVMTAKTNATNAMPLSESTITFGEMLK